jgi:dipeptidyl aminopeptidase/acylaminoacyl peptidase
MRCIDLAAGLTAALSMFGCAFGQVASPPPLEAYGALPAVEQIALSADGKQIAYVGFLEGKRRLLALTSDGKPIWSGLVGDLKTRGLQWAGDKILLLETSQAVNLGASLGYEYEIGAATSINIESGKSFLLFEGVPKVRPMIFGSYGVRQVQGHWYGFFSNLTLVRTSDDGPVIEGSHLDLYRVDLASGALHTAALESDRNAHWLVGADGEVAARADYDEQNAEWTLRAAGRTLMKRKSDLHSTSLAGFGRSSDTLLVADDEGSETHYIEVPLAAGDKPVELYPDFAVGHLVWSRSDVLLGALNEERTDAKFNDPTLAARYLAARRAFPGYEFHLADYTDDLNRMIARTDGGDDSGTYWLVDIPTGSAKVLAEDYPSIKAKQVGAAKIIRFKAADGLELEGVLTLPPRSSGKNLPLVVMPHGGPIGIHDTAGFDWWAQAFASRGYAVFQPNYRGSSGRGLEFERKGYGEWGRKMLSDIADGLGALAKDGVIDPKRACIVGASYGGYAALAGVTLQQGLYRCAASVGGVSDMTQLLARDSDRMGGRSAGMRFMRLAVGQGPPAAPTLAEISPVRLAARADAPVLLVHGRDDTVVEIDQSRKMEQALKAANKPVEFVELPGEDHWLSKSATRTAMLKAVIAFVQKYNPAD